MLPAAQPPAPRRPSPYLRLAVRRALSLPLALLCLVVAWVAIDHVLLPGVLDDRSEAIVEIGAGVAAVGLVFVAGVRRERRLLEAFASLAAGESRFRQLAEQATDGIFLVDAAGRILDANPRMVEMLGYTLDEARGRSIDEFVELREVEERPIRWGELRTGRPLLSERRMRTKDGRLVPVEIHSRLLSDGRLQGVMRDVSERVEAEEARQATERRLARVLDRAAIGLFVTDADGRVSLTEGRGWAALCGAAGSPLGGTALAPEAMPADVESAVRAALEGGHGHAAVEVPGHAYELECAPVTRADGSVEGVLGVFQDVTDRYRLEAEQRRLAAAVEQATETILVADAGGLITYANPAFTRVSGYDRRDLAGRSVTLLYGDARTEPAWSELRAAMQSGTDWTGELAATRADGSIFRQVASVAPVRDGSGAIAGYVAVQRDVTRERELEEALARDHRELASITAALERLAPGGDPNETATRICREIARLPGIDHAALLGAEVDTFVPLAVEGALQVPVEVGRPVPPTRASYLRERAALGPWAERWRVRRRDGTFGTRMAEAGMRAAAYVPLRADDRTIGVLVVGTNDTRGVDRINELLTALAAFGSLASAVLAPALVTRGRDAAGRQRIRQLIARRAFHPVFQPVVELGSRAVVGYEALTRFSDGTRPDLVFDLAYGLGLGFELEEATLRAAVEAARTLPADCWVSLNASPAFVLEGGRLARVLAAADRDPILELTEREVVQDYEALRAAIRGLGREVRLAVDDAGAGFASLRHVLELHPDAVKLDIGMIRAIDTDPARQALVAGMRHFAVAARCLLIAEGVETLAELRTLRELGVPFGQGYLLGMPAAVADGRAPHGRAPHGRAPLGDGTLIPGPDPERRLERPDEGAA